MVRPAEGGTNVTSVSVNNNGVGLQSLLGRDPYDYNAYINPAPDPRLHSIIKKMNLPLEQGIIQQTDEMVSGQQRYPFACRFMFNPTTLDVRYSASESQIPLSEQTPGQLAAVDVSRGTTTLDFSLFFDRTYEVAYGPHLTRPLDLRNIGVYADIGALEQVVGARALFATDASQVIQPMLLAPVYFVFGGGSGKAGLTFVGSITGMTVSYTLFSSRMVPMRAAVTLSATQMLGADLAGYNARGGNILQRQRRNLSAARAANEHQARRPGNLPPLPNSARTEDEEFRARRPGNLPGQ